MLPDLSKIIEYNFNRLLNIFILHEKTLPAHNVYTTQVTILGKIRGNSQESFLGIRGNSQESFTGKSGEKCRQLFPGISRNPFRGTRSEEFLVTHSEEILVTLSKEFLVTNSREFLVTNSSEKPEKICSKMVFRTNSWEFPWNYSQDFLKNSSGIS